jgi:hypothetical protein
MILSDRLQPTNKHNPCPVCEKTNGNCRIQTNGGVQCMTFPDKFSGNDHPTYRFVKPTKDGQWGIFYPRTDNDFDREKWEREKAERQRERDRIRQSRSQAALSVEARDSEIRKIIEDLKNNHSVRKAEILKKKGFSDEMIAASDLVYVEKYQKLSIKVNPGLAGVNEWGNGLTNNVSGILCFTKNELGQYTGWQIRDEDPNADHRYKWASSGSEKNKKSSHLKNGELPLSVIDNGDRSGIVVLTEGIRLKPDLASNRLNICSIGSAGGLHYNSQRQLKRALKALGASIVWLSPDAGMLTNKGVIDKYWKTIKLVESWGYTVQVLWWQQFNKTDGDIDEINQEKIDSIQYLTPDKFFDVVNLEQWKLQKKLEYKKLKIYTPTQVVNYDYISKMPTPEIDDKIIFFRASLGTGKTTLMLKILREFCLLKGAFISGCRNGLLHNIVGESNDQIIHINSNKSEFNDQDNTAWFTACWESILKIDKEWFIGKLLVMDEITSQMHHLFFSKTLEGKRYEILERFLYIIQVSSGIIAFDGHLFNGIPNLFRKICPTKTVECISNEFVIERPKINFLEGTINNQKIKPNDKSPWLRHAKDTIRTAPISMASDSRIFLKSVAEILNGLGKKGLLITSETINKLEVREFLKDPDKWILENKPDYLFYSPSAESGLNVPIKDYFKAFYAFYFGVLGVDAQRQMLMRIRDINCPRWVWLRSHSIVTENSFKYNYTSPEVIGRLIEESNLLDVGNIGDILEDLKVKVESFAAPIIELVNEYKTIAEYERIAFRECFLEAVTNDGYEVERFTPETDEETKQELKLKTKAIKDRESLEIFNASDKFIGQGKIILGEKATDDDRRAAKKAEIVNLLPTINEDPVWSPEFIRFINFERFGITSQRRRYLMATNLDLSRRLANKRYANYVHRAGFCPWDMKFEYAQAKAIASSGILELIEERVHRLTADHPLIQKIVQNCKKTSIHRALGRFPGKDPIKFVLWLLGLLGYKTKYQSIKSNGKVIREYFLDTDDIADNQVYFNAIDKFLTYSMELKSMCFQDNKIYVEHPENETFKNDLSDSTQTNTGHGFEVVADRGDIFIKNRGDLQPPQMKVEVVKVVPKNHPQNETQNQASGVKNQPTTGAVITLKMLKNLQIGDRQFTIWNDDLNEWESSEITAICENSILFTTFKGFPLWINKNNLNYVVLDEFEGMRA